MALVLYYDPFDSVSFPGEPTTNLFSSSYSFGSQLSRGASYFGSTASMEMIANPFGIPVKGAEVNLSTPISKTEYLNDNPATYGCCPAYFIFAAPTVKPKTTYTYSYYYKIQKNDYYNANFLYVYEYSSSGFITEGGKFTVANRTPYPNGWWRCWGTFTTHASSSYVNLYCYSYEYNVRNYMWMMAPQFEEKDHMTPYTSKVRSPVNGLVDLSSVFPHCNSDLTNISKSFDSNGNLAFSVLNQQLLVDGSTKLQHITDDGNDYSFECWFKPTGDPPGSADGYMFGRQGFHEGFAQQKGATNFFVVLWYSDSSNIITTLYPYTTNNLYHLVMTVSSKGAQKELKTYVNGILYTTDKITKTLYNYGTNNYYIGSGSGTNYSANGKMGLMKIYNHALSPMEVSQNYKVGLTKHQKL